jgi:hypothetical protein
LATSRYPPGLGRSGRALWRDVEDGYKLRPDERQLLARACVEVDLLEQLTAAQAEAGPFGVGSAGQPVASPLLAEIRAHNLVLARLLDQLALPADSGRAVELRQARSALGRRAVRARWAG